VSESTSRSTLFRPGENCRAVARANRVAILIDGAAYFDAFACAAQRAERSITIIAWDFDSRTPLRCDKQGKPTLALGDFLNTLAAERRRLHVRILDWDYPMIFGADREFPPPLFGLNWRPHRRVHFHYDNTHPPAGSHHQKIVVIDDKIAFVGGFDLAAKRLDTPAHRPDDPNRVVNGKAYPPFHDLMAVVDGEAAAALAAIARKRWAAATGERLSAVTTDGDPWPEGTSPEMRDVNVAVALTKPAANGDTGAHDIEQLYLDMIARAKRYIYIENQYFTADKIGAALAARLREPNPPEIVLVTRLLSHGWLEEMTMHVLRTRLIRELRAADHGNRFQVYYPHVDGLADGTCIDIHSKIMAVDDEWLRIGSANLSNRSMGFDSECDIAIEARGAAPIASAIRQLRDQLLGEHLGVSAAVVAREVEQTGSMIRAIGQLQSSERTLRELNELPLWPDAVIDAIGITDPERPVSLDRMVAQFASDVEIYKDISLWRHIIVIALLVAGLTAVWRLTPLADVVTPEAITEWARHFAGQWWAPLVVLVAYTPACVVMFPRPLITLAAVVAFGPWLGFVYGMSGILLAALATYLAGRMFRRETVRRISGEKLNRMTTALRRRGLLAMTALRLVPLAPFAVEGLVAGAIRIRVLDYVLGTFLGMLPGVLAATIFGDQIETALRDPSQVNYWLVAGVVIVLLIGSLVVKKWLARMETVPAEGNARA
jgi:phospholipase D1/2